MSTAAGGPHSQKSRKLFVGHVDDLVAKLQPHVKCQQWLPKPPKIESRGAKQHRICRCRASLQSLEQLQSNLSFPQRKMEQALLAIYKKQPWWDGKKETIFMDSQLLRSMCRTVAQARLKTSPPAWLAGLSSRRPWKQLFNAESRQTLDATMGQDMDQEEKQGEEHEDLEEGEEDGEEEHPRVSNSEGENDEPAFTMGPQAKAHQAIEVADSPPAQSSAQETSLAIDSLIPEEDAQNQYVVGWNVERKAAWRSKLVKGRPTQKDFTQDVEVTDGKHVRARWPCGYTQIIKDMPCEVYQKMQRRQPSAMTTATGEEITIRPKKDRVPGGIWQLCIDDSAICQVPKEARPDSYEIVMLMAQKLQKGEVDRENIYELREKLIPEFPVPKHKRQGAASTGQQQEPQKKAKKDKKQKPMQKPMLKPVEKPQISSTEDADFFRECMCNPPPF